MPRSPEDPATGGIRIAAELATMAAAAEVEKRTRIRLLWIHAAGKVGIGALMLTTGGLHTMEHYVGVWTRGVLGTLALQLATIYVPYGEKLFNNTIPFNGVHYVEAPTVATRWATELKSKFKPLSTGCP